MHAHTACQVLCAEPKYALCGNRWVLASCRGELIKKRMMMNMVPWTVVFVKRGTLELEQRRVIAPPDEPVAWKHVTGLIDDGWLLCMSKGSHEMTLGTLPLGKDALDDLRRPSSKQTQMFKNDPRYSPWTGDGAT